MQYTFPFELKLETYLNPSFEYPTDTHRASLRYVLEARIKSNQIIAFASTYILINAIEKKEKDSDNLNVEKSLSIKKWGLFSKGSTKLKAFYPTKNYGFHDTIPIKISIDNSQSQLKVTETKICLLRKVFLKDKTTLKNIYNKDETLITKVFKSPVNIDLPFPKISL